jgi:hypothetical protein
MALRNDFKGLKDLILHCSPLPSVNSVVSILLAKEICLQSYSKNRIFSIYNSFVLVVPSKSFPNN